MPPPGILTVIHESPDICETYAPHGLKGWYVGGSPEHYRCFDIWCPDTRQVRQVETVRFFPHDHVLPGLSPHENITRSIHELISALKHPHPASPTATFGNEQTKAIIQLSKIVHLALPVPTPVTPTTPPMTRWSGYPTPPPRVPEPNAPPPSRVSTSSPYPRTPYAPAPPIMKIPSINRGQRNYPQPRATPLSYPYPTRHATSALPL